MKIISDGTPKGTTVFDDNGAMFEAPMSRITWTIDGNSNAKASIEVFQDDPEKESIALPPFKNVIADVQSNDVIQSQIESILDPILESLEGMDMSRDKRFIKGVLVNAVLEWLRQLPSDKKADQCLKQTFKRFSCFTPK